MNAADRQLERRELARREFIKRMKDRTIVRCDWKTADDPALRASVRVPIVRDRLLAAACDWGQVSDAGDFVILHAHPRAATELAGLPRTELVRTVNWDELLPPFSTNAEGHSSFAHQALQQSYGFTAVNNPLSLNSAFTYYTSSGYGDYFQENGSYCLFNAVTVAAAYRWVTAQQPPNDCSTQVAFGTVSGAWAGVLGRAQTGSASNYYLALVYPSGASQALLFRTVGESNIQIGAGNTTATSGVMVLEMVGTILNFYVGSSRTDAEGKLVVAAADSTFAGGWAGIAGYRPGGQAVSLDDLCVYVAARPGSPARLIGPLAGRRQINFALAT